MLLEGHRPRRLHERDRRLWLSQWPGGSCLCPREQPARARRPSLAEQPAASHCGGDRDSEETKQPPAPEAQGPGSCVGRFLCEGQCHLESQLMPGHQGLAGLPMHLLCDSMKEARPYGGQEWPRRWSEAGGRLRGTRSRGSRRSRRGSSTASAEAHFQEGHVCGFQVDSRFGVTFQPPGSSLAPRVGLG